jgi:hypothetical protein
MTLAELKEVNGIAPKRKIVPGQTLLVPLRGEATPHLPDLPAPKLAAARANPKRAKCYMVSNSGAKKQVPCAAPAKKKTVAAKPPAERRVNGSGAAVSTRALTGG